MKVRTYLAWYDMWVGVYIDAKKYTIYICLLPCWVIEIKT